MAEETKQLLVEDNKSHLCDSVNKPPTKYLLLQLDDVTQGLKYATIIG